MLGALELIAGRLQVRVHHHRQTIRTICPSSLRPVFHVSKESQNEKYLTHFIVETRPEVVVHISAFSLFDD